jgi:hypothetical protein
VDRFRADAANRWETFVAIQEIKRKPSVLELELANETDDNFEDVVLEVTLPLPRARVHLSASGAKEALRPPEEPAKWGSGRIASIPIKTTSDSPTGAEVVVHGEAETLIRFPPMRARPRTRHRLPAVLLVLPPDMAGETLEARWRATSSSTRGQIADVAEIKVVVGDQASQPDDEQAA